MALAATPLVVSGARGQESANSRAQHESSVTRSAEKCAKDANKRHEGNGKGESEHADQRCSTTTLPPPPPPPPPAAVGIAEIHGSVYNDLNANGIWDLGEPGMSGWTVTLSGAVTATAVTDGAGAYAFTQLPVGTYLVCEVTRSGFTLTAPRSGAACPGGFGWSLTVPASLPFAWFGSIDFGVK
ncbi:MAG: hypothetical protein NVS4B3_24730 [Gemmatimonadaceae bacterium]